MGRGCCEAAFDSGRGVLRPMSPTSRFVSSAHRISHLWGSYRLSISLAPRTVEETQFFFFLPLSQRHLGERHTM